MATRRARSLILLATTVAMAAVPLVGAAVLAGEIVVTPGDTLSELSLEHGVTVEEIVSLNDLSDPDRIYVGQRLRLTAAAAAGPPEPATGTAAPEPPTAPAPKTHTVAHGANLTWIAREQGVSIAAIVAANDIADPGRIYAGQQLIIPAADAAPSPKVAARPAMPASMAALVAERDGVGRLIIEEAGRHGVPAAFAQAVAWQESGWQQKVVSHAGAVGVMQLLPTTGHWVGEAMLRAPVDIHDTHANVRAGVRLLAHYLDHYAGNREMALAAYYQGQYATDRDGIYEVSRPYIASILALEGMFGG